jgi:DNA-binding LytR/AlgR family response regulator
MTKDEMRELMERAVEWPEEAQVELVQSMEDIEARYYGVYITSKDERAALKRSQDDVKHGRFALHDDVKNVGSSGNRVGVFGNFRGLEACM